MMVIFILNSLQQMLHLDIFNAILTYALGLQFMLKEMRLPNFGQPRYFIVKIK